MDVSNAAKRLDGKMDVVCGRYPGEEVVTTPEAAVRLR